jgi:hypothetical protein
MFADAFRHRRAIGELGEPLTLCPCGGWLRWRVSAGERGWSGR